MSLERPAITVVLAMSADGKIADAKRSPMLFGSPADKAHLEQQVALADGVLFGAGTLRAGGTAMRITNPDLIQQREQEGKPPQPVQIVCSGSAQFDPQLRFFQQPIPRWLLTTQKGAESWKNQHHFEQILALETPEQEIDWATALEEFAAFGLQRLAVLGGGQLVSALLAANLIDEFWLTVCPLIIGGSNAPTPVDGLGFLTASAPRLELLEVQPLGQEVFLHYRLQH